MKIKFIVGLAGVGINYKPGDIIEVSPETAERYIAKSIAKLAEPKPEPAKPAKTRKAKAGK